jgi:putative membrane protein
MDDGAPRFDVQPTASNHFAWLNTQMALQRTLMAGVRTGVSLIGFGFTVAQFFERLQGKIPLIEQIRPEAPRNIGLTLIAAGVGLIGLFLWQYRQLVAYLWEAPYDVVAGIGGRRRLSGAYYSAWVVLVIGLVAFVSVFARF